MTAFNGTKSTGNRQNYYSLTTIQHIINVTVSNLMIDVQIQIKTVLNLL